MYIKNASELIENGEKRADRLARELALEAAEAALAAVEPGRLVRSKVRVAGGQLVTGGERFELSRFRRVLVIGGGKAGGAMAGSIRICGLVCLFFSSHPPLPWRSRSAAK